ncbi:MAG: hypothetical protein ACOYL0_00135 [Limnohabitans sp.]
MKQQLAFLAEANSLVHQSACALRQAQPLLLLQASEALSQLIAKWRKAEFESQETARFKAEMSNFRCVVDQLKLQQSHLRQQQAQVEKQLQVLLPGGANGLYAKTSGQRAAAITAATSVRA